MTCGGRKVVGRHALCVEEYRVALVPSKCTEMKHVIQIIRVYVNLRSDFRRTIRRYRFTDYISLAVLAAEYERVILTLGDDLAPQIIHYFIDDAG